jgi:hypothetical protein
MTQAYKTMGEAYREVYSLDEFNDAQILKLKKAYATLKGKRLSLDNNKKLTMIVNKMTKDQLVKVMNADIPFLSTSAMSTLVIKHKLKYPEIDKLRVKEEAEEDYTHYPGQVDPKKDKSDGAFVTGDPTEPIEFDGGDTTSILNKANKEVEQERGLKQPPHVEAYKLPRQLKNPKKETMVSKDKYGTIVIDKKDWPTYKAKGWKLAEELELEEGKYSQYSSLLVQKGKLIGKGFIPQSMTVKRIDKEIEKEKKKLGIKEDLDEGKYSQYSSLLVQKGKLLGKGFIPTSTTVTRIDKEIAKELKKLGIKEELEEGKMKDLHLYIQQKKSAEWIAKKMKVDVKTIKALMSSEFDPDKDKKKERIKEAEDDESEDEKVKKAKDKADKDVQVALLKKKIAALSTQEAVDLYFNNVDSETFLAEVRFADLRDKVKQATKYNDHFGARVYIAQQMKDREMESIYQALELAHRKYSRYIGNMAVKTRDKFEEIFKAKINAKWGRKLGKEIIDSL